ncbi:MAG: hypothetical protein HPM95_11785 [Alphaproteobacteria bacterium]|nr:hypothetical protein [Alphaproteobacteria bacterium]
MRRDEGREDRQEHEEDNDADARHRQAIGGELAQVAAKDRLAGTGGGGDRCGIQGSTRHSFTLGLSVV